jgi:hypothetical protein
VRAGLTCWYWCSAGGGVACCSGIQCAMAAAGGETRGALAPPEGASAEAVGRARAGGSPPPRVPGDALVSVNDSARSGGATRDAGGLRSASRGAAAAGSAGGRGAEAESQRAMPDQPWSPAPPI